MTLRVLLILTVIFSARRPASILTFSKFSGRAFLIGSPLNFSVTRYVILFTFCLSKSFSSRTLLEIVEKYNSDLVTTTKITKTPTSKNTANSISNANNTANLNPNGNLTVKVSEMRKVRGVFYERLGN